MQSLQRTSPAAIAQSDGQPRTSKPSDVRSDVLQVLQALGTDDRERTIRRQLVVLAEMRQASVSEVSLVVYSKVLRSFDPEDVDAMLVHYLETPREAGETSMPDLAQLRSVLMECHERARFGRVDMAAVIQRAEAERDARWKNDGRSGSGLRIEDALNDALRKAAVKMGMGGVTVESEAA